MKTLFDLDSDLVALYDLLDEDDGTGGDVLAVWLNEIEGEAKAKLARTHCFLVENDARIRALDDEVERLKAVRDKYARSEKRVIELARGFMQAHDIPRVESARGVMKLQAPGGVAPMRLRVDASEVPVKWRRTPTPHEEMPVDMTALRAALKEGDEEAASLAELIDREKVLRFR